MRTLLFLIFACAPFIAHADEFEIESGIPTENAQLEKGSIFDVSKLDMDVTGKNGSTLTNLEAEPSATIYNTVNVISGDYTETFEDYVVPGPEALSVQRVYSSGERSNGSLCYGWHLGKYGMLNRWKHENKSEGKNYRATIVGAGGSRMTFNEIDERRYALNKKSYEKGLTNTSTGLLSARTNPLNDRLESDQKKSVFTLVNGGGVVSTFDRSKHTPYYYLQKEIKPNGLNVLYDYDAKNRVSCIAVKNNQGDDLASVNYIPLDKKNIRILGNGLDKVNYGLEKMSSKYYLKSVTLPGGQKQHFSYKEIDKDLHSFLVQKLLPDWRGVDIEYYTKGSNDVPFGNIYIDDDRDLRLFRVKALKAPVSHDYTRQYIYKFVYNIRSVTHNEFKEGEYSEPNGGDTCVYNVYNHLTRYYYNEDQRLTSVCKFTGEGPNYNLYSSEEMFWKGPYLTNRIFLTKEGWAQYCKQYDYDSRGNVWRETLWGNLSGYNDKPIAYPASGYPEYNGCEFEFKLFTYSDDGLNLMTSMTEGKTSHTNYFYNEGTDLLAAKLTGPIGSVTKREFYEYDNNGTLTKHILDDGNSPHKDSLDGVTERHIKVVIPTGSFPKGLPAIVEEKYLDLSTGQECLQKKVHMSYYGEGKPARKDVFDANGTLAYSERWEYDASGNVIIYEDPRGYITYKKYDANNNLIYENGPGHDSFKEYTYDHSNRLIKSEIVCSNGLRLAEKSFYDMCSNKVATEDFYGNRTEYQYDEFGRVVKTIYPLVQNAAGEYYRPETSTVYNELSFPHIATDARGFATWKQFTIKGSPYRIAHADGSVESFVYNVDGTVQKQVHKNGSYTTYAYDDQKREISKEIFSSDGVLLDAQYKKYTGFRLIEETTLGGLSTSYTYDYAGRMIEMQQGSSRTTYQYDSMGRKTATCSYYGPGENDFIAKKQKFDCVDQVVEESEEDGFGIVLKKTLYEYDANGNCIKTIEETEAGLAVTNVTFDALGNAIEIKDPAGTITKTSYSYSQVNDFGQVTPYQESIDALGNKTMTTKDALGREVAILKKDVSGNPLHKTHCWYDANGNKVKQVDRIYSWAAMPREVTTEWQYDSCNRLTSTTEAVGTPEQKQTGTIYNFYGQVEHITKPDGVQLTHAYDQLGRLTSLRSTDGTIAFQYAYDLNSNAIEVNDLVSGRTTYRQYDSDNKLVEEVLGNGLRVGYTYDGIGRPLTTKLPDGSSVDYEYQASRLYKVDRVDDRGVTAYSHVYQKYSYGGILVIENYAGKAGQGIYDYDKLGRLRSYESKHIKEEIGAYDSAGNMLERVLEDNVDRVACKYQYDPLSQLITEKGYANNNYLYDSWNNRLYQNSVKPKINALNHLLDDGSCRYAYDACGNLIERTAGKERWKYAYDAMDRLTRVEKGNERHEYSYDELNRRLSKTHYQFDVLRNEWILKETESYLYHGQNEVGIVNAEGVLTQYRTLGTGKGAEIGATVLIEVDGNAYVPMHDHNGNIANLVDAVSGDVVEAYRYSAFGEELLYDSAGDKLGESINPWRFSSKRKDEETGFLYFGRRYYLPEAGRWVTADPRGFEAGMNLYAFVLNNPMTHYDLYGLFGVGGGFTSMFPSSFTTFFNRGCECLQKGLQLPGYAIERLGYHLIPLPYVQDAVRAAGTILQGRCLCGFETWSSTHSSTGFVGGEETDPSKPMVLTNGILTTREELIARAAEASANIGGGKVHYVHNATHGFMADVLECGMQKLGFKTNSVCKLANYCNELSTTIGEGGMINLYAHSQGGLMTSRLKHYLHPDVCKRMSVTTFGSPSQIHKGDFGEVNNFVSSRDLIPWFDPMSMLRVSTSNNTNTTILASTYKGVDHSWENETYKNAFSDQIYKQYNKVQ